MFNRIALAVFFCGLFTLGVSQDVRVARHLTQNEVTVNQRNVGRLANRVQNAERGTTFVFESDVELTETIFVTTNRLTFRGADGSRPTVTCAEGQIGFEVNGNNVLFEDLIIRDCTATAVDVAEEVDPFAQQFEETEASSLAITLRNVDFVNNTESEESGLAAGGLAGGFAAKQLVSATLERCRFESNRGDTGGAIFFSGQELIVEDSVFVDNVGDLTGGAIYCLLATSTDTSDDQQSTSIRIVNSEFTNNQVLGGGEDINGLALTDGVPLESNPYLSFPLPQSSGGALFVGAYDTVSIEECSFVDNRALAGGAIYLSDNEETTITGCQFTNNEAISDSTNTELRLGGAIFAAFDNARSNVEISESEFDSNRATYGGALHYVGPTDVLITITRCTFNNNVATLGGGAMVFRNIDSPTINEGDFINNTAFVGGAIFITNGAGLILPEQNSANLLSRFENNVAYDGGAIYGMGGGFLQLFAVIFDGNQAERHGGAVCYIDSKAGGTLGIQDARMFNNAAERGGAVYAENIADLTLIAAGVDVNLVALGLGQTARNEFINNRAMAGGALYYRASNLVKNNVLLSSGVFEDNAALPTLAEVHEQPLSFPGADADRLAAAPVAEENGMENNENLLNPRSIDPCQPGGGGAICMVLSGTASRAPVDVDILTSNFTRNSASSGGALFIATDVNAEWRPSCIGTDTTEALLTSDPCRHLNLRAVRFERNRAEFAGGAILAADFNHVYFTTNADDRVTESQTLDNAVQEESFFNNRVGRGGYGANIAGTAVRLNISHPTEIDSSGLIVAEQSSGQVNSLPEIRVQALDGLNQIVSAGILDSSLLVHADSRRLNNNASIAAGQVDATAVRGVATFTNLTLSAPAGRYEVNFAVRGNAVESVDGAVTLRECRLGERYNRDGFVCEACIYETFTFFTEVERCEECPQNAKCFGSASLIPVPNYWHSSPFSVIMHECFNSEACSYDNRDVILESERATQLEEFFSRFERDDPSFTEEEYTQCSIGYHGPLCGSCKDGFGIADGKRCVKCDSRSATASVIFLLAVWQLVFLAVTIRSALVSIRDMNQMMTIAQQQAAAAGPSRRSGVVSAPMSGLSTENMSYAAISEQTSKISHNTAGMPGDSALTPSEIEAQYAQNMNMAATSLMHLSGGLERQTQKGQFSAEYIIAAQHVSETIKIFVNFFQVTSVAVNINLEWTSSIKNMLATMNSVAGFSNGATFTPMTCLLDSDSENRSIHGVILRIAFPMLLMLLAMSFFFVQWFIMRRNPTITRVMSQQFIRSRAIICFLVVGFFAYQSISEDLMGTISCIQLDGDEMDQAERFGLSDDIDYSQFAIAQEHYWTEDTNIECFSSSHAYLVGFLGIPGIILFLCGVPLYLLVFLLYKRQKEELLELNVLNTYGFIYQNYEDKFVYWEVMILIRKALISAIVVFAYPLGSNLQGVMALGVLILSLAIHLIATPFKYLTLNILEGCSLVVTIFTFYAGVVFNDENTSDSAEVLLSVLLVLINSLLVMVILFTVFVYGDRYVVAKLQYLDVTNPPKNPIVRMLLLASLLSDQFRKIVASQMKTVRGGNRSPQAAAGMQMSNLPVSAGASSPLEAVVESKTPNEPAVIEASNEDKDALI